MYDDHSLIKLHSRLAAEGENLIAHKFSNGATQMVPRTSFERWRSARVAMSDSHTEAGAWQSIKSCWREFLTYYGYLDPNLGARCDEPVPVVAIPSEALLRVFEISEDWKKRYRFGSFEDALYIEDTEANGRFERTLWFGNGTMIPLQALREGQQVKVLRRWWADSLEPSPEFATSKR